MSPTGHHATIRLDAPGRQHGVIRVARTRSDDPFSVDELPAAVLSRGVGPTVAIVGAGSVGAMLAIVALARDIELDALCGSLRLLPTLLLPTARSAGLGSCAEPSSTSQAGARPLPDAAIREWLNGSDLVIELGDGPPGWHVDDTAIIDLESSPSRKARSGAMPRRGRDVAEAALVAFGATLAIRQRAAPPAAIDVPDIDLGDALAGGYPTRGVPVPPVSPWSDGTLARTCRALGTDRLVTQGHVAPSSGVDALVTGCRNVLISLDLLSAPFVLRASRQLLLDPARDRVQAPAQGLLESRSRPGAQVQRGDVVARLIDPYTPRLPPTVVRATRGGTVTAVRHDGFVRRGDGVALIADEMQG